MVLLLLMALLMGLLRAAGKTFHVSECASARITVNTFTMMMSMLARMMVLAGQTSINEKA